MKTSLQSIFGPTQRYFVLYPQFEGITLHFQFCYPYFFVDFLENIGFQGMESKKKPRENIHANIKCQKISIITRRCEFFLCCEPVDYSLYFFPYFISWSEQNKVSFEGIRFVLSELLKIDVLHNIQPEKSIKSIKSLIFLDVGISLFRTVLYQQLEFSHSLKLKTILFWSLVWFYSFPLVLHELRSRIVKKY